ncbi:efflux RND transporter periplasmic adaptor subunit [Labilibaculum antarcticum]|uniref:Efflux transporter periplasmic adaptor subunit n=1 Tax=Labilibaculum antarcticum TaxID=1717717 RepID=A0A1Y1CPD2_9BACT|nr:HlyD family efflux transporter periplasmic adaptor subunit [Labilibaculum antarcticum]BAX82225.1 efflux transporter periplasmic adaptor subunit [Labilibaculum antarcticum]
MLKRKSILLGVIVIVVCFGITFVFADMKKAPKESDVVSKEIIVPVQTIKNSKINLVLSVVGNLEASDKVDVYTEVTGILQPSQKQFLEGVRFSGGEVLLSLNDDKFRSEVFSQRSSFMNEIATILPDLKFDYPESYITWEKYLKEFDVEKELAPIPTAQNEKEKYYLAGKNIYTDYYTIKGQEIELSKYQIIAPFMGEVIESDIKTGTLVIAGQKLGEFANTKAYDLVVGIDLNSLTGIKEGNKVNIYSESTTGKWSGVVRRISNKVDDETQMVDIYIAINGSNLKEGMFLSANIELKKDVFGIEIPRKFLVNSEYVFTVKDGVINQQQVSVVQKKTDSVILEGLEDNALLVLKTTGIHKGISVTTREQ